MATSFGDISKKSLSAARSVDININPSLALECLPLSNEGFLSFEIIVSPDLNIETIYLCEKNYFL
jgi:hypothetical protein